MTSNGDPLGDSPSPGTERATSLPARGNQFNPEPAGGSLPSSGAGSGGAQGSIGLARRVAGKVAIDDRENGKRKDKQTTTKGLLI
jgi:hypothetical protein